MKRLLTALPLAALLAAGLALAHEGHDHGKAKAGAAAPRSAPVTLKGEFIDPQCYFTHDSRGADHAACARNCAEGGQDLAFLDDANGKIYPLIAPTHGKNPNDVAMAHIGRIVTVKGVAFTRHGNTVLLVQTVTPAVAAAKPAKGGRS